MRLRWISLAAGLAVALTATQAGAHISVLSGPGYAGVSQEITFGVGHGCAGADTYAVRIELPAGVTSLRAETSDFGRATVERNASGVATAVSWQRADQDLLATDDNYYKLTLRFKVPTAPFTTVYFPTRQTCKAADGGLLVTDWTGTPASPPSADGGAPEPAPSLRIVPARTAGWNKVTAPVALATTDLATYFGDALIVWKGAAAYSANLHTAAQIAATAGVSVLTSVGVGDELWVRY